MCVDVSLYEGVSVISDMSTCVHKCVFVLGAIEDSVEALRKH